MKASANQPLVELVNPDDLKLDPKNPRSISKADFAALMQSIEQFGFVEPVVVNKRNMMVVGGHQRVRAARELKLRDVPVAWVDMDEQHQAALNVALNKISGTFDTDMLSELILELDEDLVGLTGYSPEELNKLTGDPFDEPPKEEKPKGPKKYSTEELRTLAKGIYPAEAATILEFLEVVDRASN